MAAITLIFPHQLFERHPALQQGRKVLLVEEELYFRQYPFHLQKLLLHRATMTHYQTALEKKGFQVEYHRSKGEGAVMEQLLAKLASKSKTELHLADPVDYLLRRRIDRYARKYGLQVHYYPSPNFINTSDDLHQYFDRKKRYFLTEFYIEQRKKQDILLHKGGPVGGKWTYDEQNRKKLPRNVTIPAVPRMSRVGIPDTLLRDIRKEYPSNYGDPASFNYPLTHREAEKVLDDFLELRFQYYGTYQDALHTEQSILFHSLLTPALNIGLLDPNKVLAKVVGYAKEKALPINETEGFVRQVLGWREFIRAVYEREGVRQRTTNFWGFSHPMPAPFWTGQTGIPPVDRVIQRLLETGYSNHIERLMVLGNFMCLCEIDPDEVYRWFMTLYIDAYDWVMVPNVYGMSQFADGGLMSTKPYISGSNYILKMSSYPKGDWCAVWDGLFWRFMHRHRDFFKANPRLSMLLGTLDRMSPEVRKGHLNRAEKFLQQIHSR